MRRRTVQPEFDRLFRCFDPLSRHLIEAKRRTRTVSKSAAFLATERVNSAPFKRRETQVQIFWQGKVQNSSPILRWKFLARKGAKFIANFSATKVTSLPSHSLSLSLSLCISLSHRAHLTHNRRLAELLSGCVQRGKPALSSALPGRPRTYQRLGEAIACIQISTAGS